MYLISLSRNQIFFNQFLVKRVPGHPMNNGSNAIIKFYIDYPDDVMSAQVPKAILASLISSELHKLQNLTRLSIILLTEVVPEAPSDPTPEQRNNAVSLRILSFSVTQVLSSSCLHRLLTLTNEFRTFY